MLADWLASQGFVPEGSKSLTETNVPGPLGGRGRLTTRGSYRATSVSVRSSEKPGYRLLTRAARKRTYPADVLGDYEPDRELRECSRQKYETVFLKPCIKPACDAEDAERGRCKAKQNRVRALHVLV